MGKAEAEARDEPMADASKEERSTSEELVPDDPESLYYRAHKSASRVPRQFKAASHVALPPRIMAAMTEEAPDMPNEESDGTFVCPDCDVRPDSVVRAPSPGSVPQRAPVQGHLPSAFGHGQLPPRFSRPVVSVVARRFVF